MPSKKTKCTKKQRRTTGPLKTNTVTTNSIVTTEAVSYEGSEKENCIEGPKETNLTKNLNLADILMSDNYQNYSVKTMKTLEKDHGLRHVDFVDIVMAWISSGKHTEEEVLEVWGNVRKRDLELWYYYYLTKTFDSEHRESNFGKEYRLPDGMLRIKHKYQRECFSINKLCKHNIHSLFNKETVVFFNQCDDCGRKYDVNLRLSDGQPCYDLTQEKHAHSTVYHWYLVYEEVGTCRLFRDTEFNTYYSMVTNTRQQVVAKIKQLMANRQDVVLYCMYKCNGAKFTKPKAKGHVHGPPCTGQMVD